MGIWLASRLALPSVALGIAAGVAPLAYPYSFNGLGTSYRT